jgi:hypothetical protein
MALAEPFPMPAAWPAAVRKSGIGNDVLRDGIDVDAHEYDALQHPARKI